MDTETIVITTVNVEMKWSNTDIKKMKMIASTTITVRIIGVILATQASL